MSSDEDQYITRKEFDKQMAQVKDAMRALMLQGKADRAAVRNVLVMLEAISQRDALGYEDIHKEVRYLRSEMTRFLGSGGE